jgi:hypothetical protein
MVRPLTVEKSRSRESKVEERNTLTLGLLDSSTSRLRHPRFGQMRRLDALSALRKYVTNGYFKAPPQLAPPNVVLCPWGRAATHVAYYRATEPPSASKRYIYAIFNMSSDSSLIR